MQSPSSRLRTAALAAVLTGAVGSLALLLHAGRGTPRFLLVVFVIWVLSPFIVLAAADAVSARWSTPTRRALYCVMIVVALASLAVYGDDAMGHRRPQAAFVYVIVAPVSWLVLSVVVPVVAFVSGRRSQGTA